MLIAVSCGNRVTQTSSGMIETHSLVPCFNDLINEQGGTGIIIPPQNTVNIDELMSAVGGLIITGGGDINPKLYNAKNTDSKNISDKRDELEMSLLSSAEMNQIRTLAICRGHQMLNVYKGGTLIQDIPSQFNDANSHAEINEKTSEHVHDVHIDKESKLYDILNEQRIDVNSIHHQCIDELGDDLKISAKSSDGIVEGIETNSDWDALGIQWHPEYLKEDQVSKNLFDWLVNS